MFINAYTVKALIKPLLTIRKDILFGAKKLLQILRSALFREVPSNYSASDTFPVGVTTGRGEGV